MHRDWFRVVVSGSPMDLLRSGGKPRLIDDDDDDDDEVDLVRLGLRNP